MRPRNQSLRRAQTLTRTEQVIRGMTGTACTYPVSRHARTLPPPTESMSITFYTSCSSSPPAFARGSPFHVTQDKARQQRAHSSEIKVPFPSFRNAHIDMSALAADREQNAQFVERYMTIVEERFLFMYVYSAHLLHPILYLYASMQNHET